MCIRSTSKIKLEKSKPKRCTLLGYTHHTSSTMLMCAVDMKRFSVLVMVHTAMEHFFRRKEMRRTWLNTTHYSPKHLKVIFLVGTTGNKTMQEQLRNESNVFHDIIQGDFVDTYRNLTNKGVMGY